MHVHLHSRPPYERMLFIHDQLKRDAYPNCTTILKHFELDRRTVLRDIEFMRDRLHCPLTYDQSLRLVIKPWKR